MTMQLVGVWVCLVLVVMCLLPVAICQNVQNYEDSVSSEDDGADIFDRIVNFVTNATGSLPPPEESENIPLQVFGANTRSWFQNLVPGDAYIASCGGLSTSEKTIWQNSEYPESELPPGFCTLKLLPPAGTCALRIHFDDLNLMPAIDDGNSSPVCPHSQPFFKATTPSRLTAVYCQNLSGYEGIIPIWDTFLPTILLLQLDPNGVKFQFKVSVTAVNCNDIKTYESPSNCGIKNQDLATLRAELFGVEDFEESQDSAVVENEDHLPVRQSRRNLAVSDGKNQEQNNKRRNKNKERNKVKQNDKPFIPPVIEEFKKGLASAEAAGTITKIDTARVLGEQTTLINEWPWIVYIEITLPDSSDPHTCNGILLDNSKVLTSRDCALSAHQQPYGVENMIVNIGDHDISTSSEVESKSVTVSKVSLPLLNGIRDTKDAFAVLHLSEELELSETIRPICLPVSYNTFDDSGVVSGWDLSSTALSTLPNEAKVKLTDETHCNSTLHQTDGYVQLYETVNFDVDDVVCAQDAKEDKGVVCPGESGSALVQRDRRGAYYVTGVAGAANSCKYKCQPTVFSKIEPDNQFLNIALA